MVRWRQRRTTLDAEWDRAVPQGRIVRGPAPSDPGNETPMEVEDRVVVGGATRNLGCAGHEIRAERPLGTPTGAPERRDRVGGLLGIDEQIEVDHGTKTRIGVVRERERHALESHRPDTGAIQDVERGTEPLERQLVVDPGMPRRLHQLRNDRVVDARVHERARQHWQQLPRLRRPEIFGASPQLQPLVAGPFDGNERRLQDLLVERRDPRAARGGSHRCSDIVSRRSIRVCHSQRRQHRGHSTCSSDAHRA